MARDCRRRDADGFPDFDTFSSVGFLTTPAVSLVLANLFLGEAFTVDLLLGSALIIGGVGFAAWPGRQT